MKTCNKLSRMPRKLTTIKLQLLVIEKQRSKKSRQPLKKPSLSSRLSKLRRLMVPNKELLMKPLLFFTVHQKSQQLRQIQITILRHKIRSQELWVFKSWSERPRRKLTRPTNNSLKLKRPLLRTRIETTLRNSLRTSERLKTLLMRRMLRS